MVDFVGLKPELIVQELTQVASAGGRWLLEEKRSRLYPLTAELLGCGVDVRREVACLLAQRNGHCGYAAIALVLEGCRQTSTPTIFLPVDTFAPADPWGKFFLQPAIVMAVVNKIEVGLQPLRDRIFDR